MEDEYNRSDYSLNTVHPFIDPQTKAYIVEPGKDAKFQK